MRYLPSADGVPTIYLTIGCDTDPDRVPTSRTVTDPDEYWRGITKGIPALRAAFRSAGCAGTLITWLLRSDRQMQFCFGSFAYPAERYLATWREAIACGDEIGWHPHLWDWDPERSEWYPSLWDDEIVAELPIACAALREVFDVRSSRTGWTHCNNAVMRALSQAGIRVDFSAMPGQVYVGTEPTGRVWFNDWRGVPWEPYFPSWNDYRTPGGGANELPILEVPITPTSIGGARAAARWCAHAIRWSRARLAVGARSPWSALPPYFRAATRTVTTSPEHVSSSISPVVQRALREGAAAYVTYFHTDELLIPANLAHFTRNVTELRVRAERKGVRVQPTTASGLAALARPR